MAAVALLWRQEQSPRRPTRRASCEMVSSMPDVGLYYPWINFRDENWLKLSLLYWQRMLRIAPGRTGEARSGLVHLLEEEGLVTAIDPGPAALTNVARLVARVIEAHEAQVRTRYGLSGRPRDTIGESADNDRGLTYLHLGKFTEDLIVALEDSGLGIRDPDGWLMVHPDIARVYMAVLAETVADASGASPVTDDPLAHVAVGAWSAETLAEALLGVQQSPVQSDVSRATPDGASLALVSMRMAVPANLDALDVQRLISIRNHYGTELTHFRDNVADLVEQAGLASVSHPAAFQLHLEDLYHQRIEPELIQLRRDLKLFGIDVVDSLINVKTAVPSTLAVAFAEHAVPGGVGASGAAVAVGVLGLRHGIAARAAHRLHTSPAACLLRLQDELGNQDKKLPQSIKLAIRRLTLGV
jgi:Family of unknown function (DUF6236)